jgi:hypothetical protein
VKLDCVYKVSLYTQTKFAKLTRTKVTVSAWTLSEERTCVRLLGEVCGENLKVEVALLQNVKVTASVLNTRKYLSSYKIGYLTLARPARGTIPCTMTEIITYYRRVDRSFIRNHATILLSVV